MKKIMITALLGFFVMVSFQSAVTAGTTQYMVPNTDVNFTITSSTSVYWFTTSCHVRVAVTQGSGWIKHIQSVCAWAIVNQPYTQAQKVISKTVTSSAIGWGHSVGGYVRVCSTIDPTKCISVNVR